MLKILKIGEDLSDNKPRLKTKYQINLFAIVISTTLAILYWLLRYGFYDNSILILLKVLSLSYLMILLPDYIKRIKFLKNKANLWYFSTALLSIALLFLLIFMGWLALVTNLHLINLLVLLSLTLLILFFIEYFLFFFRKTDILYFIFFLILAFSLAAIVWGHKYQNPLFDVRMIFGLAHSDTLTYSSISSMIQTYGFPSIGVDGLKYMHYHWGSSWIFAYLSGLLDIGTIKFYNLAYPIIFIAFLLKSILTLTMDLRDYKNINFKINFLFFFLLLIGFIRLGFPAIGNESYLMAVSFSLVLFSAALYFIKDLRLRNNRYNKGDFVFLLLFLPIFLAIIGCLKISLAFILYGLFDYLFLRLKLYKKFKYILSLLICILSAIFVFWAFCYTESSQGWATLAYLYDYFDKWRLFTAPNYLLFWLAILFFVTVNNIDRFKDIKDGLVGKLTLEIEILLVVCLLGLLPGATMIIGGGSSQYFSNFQQIVSLILVLAYLGNFAGENIRDFVYNKLRSKNLRIFLVVLVIITSLGNWYLIPSYDYIAWSLFANNIFLRRKLSYPTEIGFSPIGYIMNNYYSGGVKGITRALGELKNPVELNQFKNYKIISLFEKLSNLSREEKRKTAIYIPKSNRIFWEMDIYNNFNHARPLLAAAITGMALIDGVPEGKVTDYSGYSSYKNESRNYIDESNNNSIRADAESKGFSRVLVIRQRENQLVVESL